jgi:ABC-type anion transport system duplicated permease subunit
VAAVAPLFDVFTDDDAHSTAKLVIALACWGVFATDLAVHVTLRPGYLRSKIGVFDAVIVVGTFPWYLISGVSAASASCWSCGSGGSPA